MTKPLWHYTDVNGLWGIATSSRLRFGDARFLNDRTERTYGDGLLEQVLEQEVASDPDGVVARFRNLLRSLKWPDRLYVCSFSGTSESISQWQRYGADGAGYCIGFDGPLLDELLDHDHISRHEMIYSEEEQKELLRNELREAVKEYRDIEAGRKGHHSVYDYIFTDMGIDGATLRLKNPFFHDEAESRYFLRRDDDEEPKESGEEFAIRGSFVKPYLLRPAALSKDQKLPITCVVCGPRLDVEIAVPATTRFMKARGYDVLVVGSALREIWR